MISAIFSMNKCTERLVQLQNNLIDKIAKLKHDRKAIILAHNYQLPEVQDIADVLGDSYALSKHAANTEHDVIVFCGVHFMAESAKILSPQKTVLLPVKEAGCPMADMVDAKGLRELKKKHPDAAVVCYVNSTAEVKAESDVCCTSSNAFKIVKSLAAKKIIFVPDQNLGSYIEKLLPQKEIILWEGFCPTHHRVSIEDVELAKKKHPNAKILMHPECSPQIQKIADFLGSTSQIIDYARSLDDKEIIIGTEEGILHKLKEQNPDKTFHMLSSELLCPNMKKTRLEDVYNALLYMQYEISIDEQIRSRALTSLEEMIKLG